MLNDQSLQIAAEAAGKTLLNAYTAHYGESHIFSQKYRKKMNKVVRRAKHPVAYKALRSAAAIALVIVTLFGALLAVSPKVRASVFGWFQEIFGIYHHYAPSDAIPGNTEVDYYLSVVPDGYTLLEESDIGDGKVFIYQGTESMIRFTYLFNSDNSELFVNPEGGSVEKVTVGSVNGTAYITEDKTKTNQIVWPSSDGNVLFTISAKLERDELIALAESVKSK